MSDGKRREKFYSSYEYRKYCESLAQAWSSAGIPRCFFCGIEFSETVKPTRDHLFPRSRGGNEVVLACEPCNKAKAATNLHRFRVFTFARSDVPFFAERVLGVTLLVSHFTADMEIEAVRLRVMQYSNEGRGPIQ